MLVDIAERCLSDSFDDPTTAVAAVDRLHDCLRQLATRPFPSGEHHDGDGNLRLTVRVLDWSGFVELAFDEIRQAGSSSIQLTRRLKAALEDLKGVAPPDRQAPLDRQLRLLEGSFDGVAEDGQRRSTASTADGQGLGSGRDLRTQQSSPAPTD